MAHANHGDHRETTSVSSVVPVVSLSALLAVAFLAAHLAFLPKSLEDVDSINFALGMRRFDVAQHQPHPPGYPVYIAVARAVNGAVHDEAKALGLVSVAAGAAGVLGLIALFAALDRRTLQRWPILAGVLAATCPLYWFTAVRPLSDVAGFAFVAIVQALTIGATSGRDLVLASFLAGLGIGIRLQVAWLTVPLLLYVMLKGTPRSTPDDQRLTATAAFGLGIVMWAVPLVALSGGPAGYWRAVFNQGAEDLTNIEMLWTHPTPRQMLVALYYAFIAPWGTWPLATAVLIFAAAGFVLLWRNGRSVLVLMTFAFGPYLIFDVLFQETFTSRYALPLVVPVVYLAVRAASALPRHSGQWLALLAAGVSAIIGAVSISGYSSMRAPAFRLIDDMRAAAAIRRENAARVLAMHRRADFDLRRPILWTGSDMPSFSRRLAAPPKHEWLELVQYWNGGGQDPVWFVAEPLRTDLALVDRTTRRTANYRWPLGYPLLLAGARPYEMDWHILDSPGWFLGQGWALTPETAGVSEEDRRGPSLGGIDGWIRRRPDAATIMIGGRNLVAGAPPSSVAVALDGRQLNAITAPPGFFLGFVQLAPGALAGAGRYARISVAADRPGIVVEQFDAESIDRVVFGFGEGWHETEYNPSTGRLWRWMSERGVIRVHAGDRPLKLTVDGETERFSRDTNLTLRVGDRILARWTVGNRFSVDAAIPAGLLTGTDTPLIVESDQFFVPAQRSWRSRDQRHLALRVYDVQLRPAS